MYKNGFGVPQDYKEAVEWYRKAADQGDAVGQYNLGQRYTSGEGVLQNYKEAHIWFSLAVYNGYKPAQESLAQISVKLSPAQLAEAQEQATKRLKQIEERQK
jgi:hypothetical protein